MSRLPFLPLLCGTACLLSNLRGTHAQSSLSFSASPSYCTRTDPAALTCHVDGGEKAIAGNVIIEPPAPAVTTGNGAAIGPWSLQIDSGSTLRCYGDLCKIAIKGFANVVVSGILEGSDIFIEAAEKVEVPLGGVIRGNGMGDAKNAGTGAGSGSCGYKNTKFRGASYGGKGGIECVHVGQYEIPATYGSKTMPTDFGSGGACGGSGGGKMQIAAPNIIVNGMIQENGDDKTSGGLASGGSVLLIADQIVGSGAIEAQGGDCGSATNNCAAGGGGRISLNGDSISKGTLVTNVSGGGMVQCDEAKGQPGTVHMQCRTASCFNGGSPLPGDECGCECIPPWGGNDCTTCLRTCINGGVLNPLTCTCACPEDWTGDTCASCSGATVCSGKGRCNSEKVCTCDTNYYGTDCGVFCESSASCSTNGFCSPDGLACNCKEGIVGPTCACDKLDCAASATTLCSNNGDCVDGECRCDPGYYGCNCDSFCSKLNTCSNHGTCFEDGACACEANYNTLEDCSELNIENYCRRGENGEVFTKSGFPCLPGLDDTLGLGFDIVRGETRSRIFQLRYTKKKTFDHNLHGTFEIPDDVDCEEITVSKELSSTELFTGTLKYREALATEFGILGKFKSSYFSASAQFRVARDFRFRQQQILMEKKQYHRMFRCKIQTEEAALTKRAGETIAKETGSSFVDRFGTHAIDQAEFGGSIKVKAYLSSCLLATLDTNVLETEVKNAFAGVVIAGEHTSSCGIFDAHSEFEKEVAGGEHSKLIVADMRDKNFLDAWIDSLPSAPAVMWRSLLQLGTLNPDLEREIEEYEVSNVVGEEITWDKEEVGACVEVARGASTCDGAATGLSTEHESTSASSGRMLSRESIFAVAVFALAVLRI